MIIKELREQKGWSQSDLSLNAGVKISVIQKWEQGLITLKVSSGENLLKVAKALDTTVEELLKE